MTMRRRSHAEAHRGPNRIPPRLEVEGLLKNYLAALHDGDFSRGKLHVRQARRPVRIGTACCGRAGCWRRSRGETDTQVSILNLGRREGLLSAGRDRRLVLAGRRVSALVCAERGSRACRFHGDGHISVAEARQTEATLQGCSLIREGGRAAFEVNASRVNKRHCDGADEQSHEDRFGFFLHDGIDKWLLCSPDGEIGQHRAEL